MKIQQAQTMLILSCRDDTCMLFFTIPRFIKSMQSQRPISILLKCASVCLGKIYKQSLSDLKPEHLRNYLLSCLRTCFISIYSFNVYHNPPNSGWKQNGNLDSCCRSWKRHDSRKQAFIGIFVCCNSTP